jgi:uncharacterized protein YjbI with pentapeptide repeats
MPTIEITNRYTGTVIWGGEAATLKEAVLAARANLKGANLMGANFEDADLAGADLARADLKGADLEVAIR